MGPPFRPCSRTCSYLGHRLDHDVEGILLHFTTAYELPTYDFPIYVGPNAHPGTEELRSVFRMLKHLSPAVPEYPKEGGQILMMSMAFASADARIERRNAPIPFVFGVIYVVLDALLQRRCVQSWHAARKVTRGRRVFARPREEETAR